MDIRTETDRVEVGSAFLKSIPAVDELELGSGVSYLSAVLEVAGSDKKTRLQGSSRAADSNAQHGHCVATVVTTGAKAIDLAVNGRGNLAMKNNEKFNCRS